MSINQMAETKIIQEAKEYFLLTLEEMPKLLGDILSKHLQIMPKWTEKILTMYSEADPEIVGIAAWFHDIGYLDCENFSEDDHAVYSERRVIDFLVDRSYPQDNLEKIAHCIRAHRCRDIQPITLEAKIIAVADSASHLTDYAYINLIQLESREYALQKLKRDYRDLGLLPEVKAELNQLYAAWLQLIACFPEWKIA